MCCGSSRPLSGKRTECPNCQKKITEIRGIKLKKCPYCNEELPSRVSSPKTGTVSDISQKL